MLFCFFVPSQGFHLKKVVFLVPLEALRLSKQKTLRGYQKQIFLIEIPERVPQNLPLAYCLKKILGKAGICHFPMFFINLMNIVLS